MKILKNSFVQPLKWSEKSFSNNGKIYKSFHGSRNGFDLDVCEIKSSDGKSVRTKNLDFMGHFISAKIQELFNGKVIKTKKY